MPNFKYICKMLGGSHAYGLNTPNSDLDYRGVFLHTEPRYIIGLDRFEHLDKKGETDEFYWELRHFLGLLRKTNTQVLEVLCNENWLEITPEFRTIISQKNQLMDSERFFKSLLGYINGERRLMTGERTGELGSKRKRDIDKYGFSYKNAVQLLRLTFCGTIFFTKGYFPVDIRPFDLHYELMDIKLNPEKHSVTEILEKTEEREQAMKLAFDSRSYNYKFNEEVANSLCQNLYLPQLTGQSHLLLEKN